MLVLSRKPGEKVRIGKDITLMVVEVKNNRVRIGFEAPGQISIFREELLELPDPSYIPCPADDQGVDAGDYPS
jgi:carbon storage regulator